MSLDKQIFREPPLRLYYRKDAKHRMCVSRYRKEDTDDVYLNWSEVLRRLDGLMLDPDTYWTIRKMMTEIV